jgi:hypothetical protein
MLYLIPACCVFSIFLSALWLKEPEPVEPVYLWPCIILASLLWPATLPSMVAKGSSVCWQVLSKPLAK